MRLGLGIVAQLALVFAAMLAVATVAKWWAGLLFLVLVLVLVVGALRAWVGRLHRRESSW